MSETLKFEVVPSRHWVEGDQEGWSYPELRATGRHDGKPVKSVCPMVDTDPATVELAKDLIRKALDAQQGITL